MNKMRKIPHIQEAVFSEPWFLTPEKMSAICQVVESAMEDRELMAAVSKMENPKSELQMVNNVAIIPVQGVISRRMNMFSRISGGTSTELIDQQLTEALNSKAKAILFQIDSPGGAASGIPELADRIYEARAGDKVLISCIEGAGCSAAYYIASQCDEVYCTESSQVGSVGVVFSTTDNTRQLENAGVKPLVFRSSELKAAGEGPITQRQAQSIQERVDALAALFRSDVERAREIDFSSFDPGSVFIGKKALEMGLVDGIETMDHVLKKYK